ncbi:MAG: DUF2997 domain-containing protein [Isosphaeraceae bacterium]
MTRVIEITVAQDGSTTVETKGFQGPSCRDASRFMEEALGRHVNQRQKHEFYITQTDTRQEIRQ